MKQSVQTDNEIDRFASGSAPNHAENGIAHLILLLALSGVYSRNFAGKIQEKRPSSIAVLSLTASRPSALGIGLLAKQGRNYACNTLSLARRKIPNRVISQISSSAAWKVHIPLASSLLGLSYLCCTSPGGSTGTYFQAVDSNTARGGSLGVRIHSVESWRRWLTSHHHLRDIQSHIEMGDVPRIPNPNHSQSRIPYRYSDTT